MDTGSSACAQCENRGIVAATTKNRTRGEAWVDLAQASFVNVTRVS